ncbi:hypothetical protein RINTHH_19420 [Richelia intracellularis HH01]|uniref:Uncharacterized protein n=1 Tax=Richelia intracellularis HH01 TaxID=1165094 RepID=M1X043_9NOST|nr:hypothetical protein RINTHH_19420 [Richelia intracellularis HH01]
MPDTYTKVLAVPRSIPISRDNENLLKIPTLPFAPTYYMQILAGVLNK